MSDAPKIFESPNKGQTIYARDFGTSKQTLHSIDKDILDELSRMSREILWNDIHEAAKTNQALQIAIENVIMLYHLTEKKDGTK